MRAVSWARRFTSLLRLARGLLVAGILLQSAGVRAQGTTGTLTGRVIDESTSQRLAGVTIEIVDAEETTLRASTSTDAKGNYAIINVSPGGYRLRASLAGYGTVEIEDLLVTVGVSTSRTFQLYPNFIPTDDAAFGFNPMSNVSCRVILIRPELERPIFRALTIAFIVRPVEAAVAVFVGMGRRRAVNDSAARLTPPGSLG